MKDNHIIIFAIGALFIMMVCCYKHNEKFADKDTKARAIQGWFGKNSAPTFTAYKQQFGDDATIVNYEDALNLAQKNMLSVNSIAAVI